MDKILQDIKNSEERLQTSIENLEGRFGQCHGSKKEKDFTSIRNKSKLFWCAEAKWEI